MLICSHWEHRQHEGVLCVHGGSLRYEEIVQIHKWYDFRKEKNLHSKNSRVRFDPEKGPMGPDPFLGQTDLESG